MHDTPSSSCSSGGVGIDLSLLRTRQLSTFPLPACEEATLLEIFSHAFAGFLSFGLVAVLDPPSKTMEDTDFESDSVPASSSSLHLYEDIVKVYRDFACNGRRRIRLAGGALGDTPFFQAVGEGDCHLLFFELLSFLNTSNSKVSAWACRTHRPD